VAEGHAKAERLNHKASQICGHDLGIGESKEKLSLTRMHVRSSLHTLIADGPYLPPLDVKSVVRLLTRLLSTASRHASLA